jgi:Rieske Fe-S protein
MGTMAKKPNEKTETVRLGRRAFLLLSGGAAVGLALGGAGCGSSEDPDGDAGLDGGGADGDGGNGDGGNGADQGPDLGLLAGQVADFALGSVTLFSSDKYFVLRDADGLYAMTAVCTHQGCTVNAGTDDLLCPCHDSLFDLNGGVLNGPATTPLVHYLVSLDGDDVYVDPDQIVPAATRLPV